MNLFKFGTAIAVLFFAVVEVFALGPHECVIIANRNSMGSVEIANYYGDLRMVPPINMIHLDLPDKLAIDVDLAIVDHAAAPMMLVKRAAAPALWRK